MLPPGIHVWWYFGTDQEAAEKFELELKKLTKSEIGEAIKSGEIVQPSAIYPDGETARKYLGMN